MASRSNSSSDMVFMDGEFSPNFQEIHSPYSSYSTYSQEIKYIFEPDFGRSSTEDYSQIHLPLHRTHTQQSNHPPQPPPRTSSVSSVTSDYSSRSFPVNYHTYNAQYYSSQQQQQQQPHYQYQHHNKSRRRTWSPSGLKQGICQVQSLNNSIKSCHSNDQLLDNSIDSSNSSHVTEESSDIAPPRLAPISGKLSKSPGQGIIRPIAFKPVVLNQNYVNTRNLSDRKYSTNDDDYGSHDYHMTSHNVSDISHSSIQMDSDRSLSFSSEHSHKHFTPERSESLASSNVSRVSSSHIDCYVQTPSPSDSGVGELEAMLKEKDAEINTLREVMDKNERAIIQVYEEKKNSWLKQLRDMKDDCERKIQTQQRKAYKMEQVLSLQVFKLQQEKKSLQEEFNKISAEKDNLYKNCEIYREESNNLRTQLAEISLEGRKSTEEFSDLRHMIDALNDSLAQKTEEAMLLQSQLEEKQFEIDEKEQELSEKFREVISKTEEIKSLKGNLERISGNTKTESDNSGICHNEVCTQTEFMKSASPKRENSESSLTSEKDRRIAMLEEKIKILQEKVDAKDDHFEKEKEQWYDEKNKVIRYQKQLQLNYVQMYRKNRMLEAEVEQLTLELESRDLKLMALNGGEESVC